MNKSFSYRFAEWVVGHKWMAIVLSLAFVGAAAFGAKKLSLSGDYRIFFKAEDPQLKAFDALQKTYSKNDNVLFVLAPKDKQVFTAATLDAIKQLTDQAWKLPYSSRVDSVTNYQYSRADGDNLTVSDLVEEPNSLTPADLERIRKIAVGDPLLVKRIISENGQVTGVNVTVQMPDKNKVEAIRNLVQKSRELKAKFELEHPGIEVHMTGVAMLNSAFMEATRSDMRRLMPLMMGVVAVMLLITMRSYVATGLVLLGIVVSVASTMGIAGWAGVVLSAPLATAPLTVMVLAIADGVHVLSHYGHAVQSGKGREESMIESIGANVTPMLLTNVLSAIGYLTMNFSEVPPFQTLGNVVAVGIMIGFGLSVILIPALALLFPTSVKSREEEKITLMERYQEFFLKHRNAMLAGSILVTVGLGAFAVKNEFNDSFHEYFDKSTEFRRDTDFTLEHLTGVYMIDYSIGAGGPDQMYRPEFLQKLDEFAEWYRQQPEVLHVNTITDVMKRLNKNMHGDDPAYYRLPETRELGAQYLLLYELSLPYGLDLTNQINLDKSATRVTVTLKAVKSGQMLALEQRAGKWLSEHGDGLLRTSGGTGAGMMFARIGKENGKSMLLGNIQQIILISLLIVFAIRSFRIGIASLIPNLAPAAMAYGLWGMMVGEINMAVAMVASISIGIVVDDTVHFLSKYLHARRKLGQDPEGAIRYAFDLAGVPMWIATFILIAGFMVLASSPFAMNADMGILTAVTIIFAALTEACMLPGLLLLIDRPGRRV